MAGAVHDAPEGFEKELHMEELARFALHDHNQKNNALVEFLRVVKVKQQVVAGMMYHLTIEAADGGKKKLYEAKIWEKKWLNHKEIKEFNHLGDSETTA